MNEKSIVVDLEPAKILHTFAVQVRVKGLARLKLRFWLAAQLTRLAAKLAGTRFSLELQPETQP